MSTYLEEQYTPKIADGEQPIQATSTNPDTYADQPGQAASASGFTDKVLKCRECAQDFTFTAGEQEFYQQKGLMNAPSRCPNCRAARREGQGRGGSTRGAGGSRPKYDATCAECGIATQIPFQPTGDRPVYCSDCFEKKRSQSTNTRSW